MKRIILTALMYCGFAHAVDVGDTNLFVTALKTGSASAPLPTDGSLKPAIQSLQKLTGDTGPIFVEVRRIARFQQQSRCGRVVFLIVQPSTNRGWPELGGQLNICEDGTPPWRVCKSQPNILAAPDRQCADKSSPIDSPEVEHAIQAANSAGSMSPDQIRKRMAASATKQKQPTTPSRVGQ